jgi:hypothetical protein
MRDRVCNPFSVLGSTVAALKNSLFVQVVYQRIGVITFMAYALPAMFDITAP